MKQFVMQFPTYGVRVDDLINAALKEHPGYQLVRTENMPVHRQGGSDIHVLATFEQLNEIVKKTDTEAIVEAISDLTNAIREAYRTLR